MPPKTLSVVIPCYNEIHTLEPLVDSVLAANTLKLKLDVIIIDDGSTDGSVEIARGLVEKNAGVRLFEHAHNMGKGAALQTGFAPSF